MDGEGVVLDAPVEAVESPAADVAVAQDVNEQSEVQEQEQEQQPEQSGDGRTLPKDIQRAVKSLKESNDPILAKAARTLNDSFFRLQRMESEFPPIYENGQRVGSIEQAVALKAEFEAIGRGMNIIEYVHVRCAELRAAPNRNEYWRQLIAERTGQ